MGTLIFKIIQLAVRAITPELRNRLVGALADLKKQAAATESPWDDLLIQILITMLDADEEIS